MLWVQEHMLRTTATEDPRAGPIRKMSSSEKQRRAKRRKEEQAGKPLGCALVGGLREDLEEWFPIRGDFAPPRILAMSGDIFLLIKLENVALLVSSGWRTRMLNILRGTEQPMTKDYLVSRMSVVVPRLRNRLRAMVLTRMHMRPIWGVFKRSEAQDIPPPTNQTLRSGIQAPGDSSNTH